MKSIHSIWMILTPRQRRAAMVLLGMMLVSMVLEMLGVGLVLPALAFMSGTERVDPEGTVAKWLVWLGNPTQQQLILGGLALLLAVYVVKTAFVAGVHYWQSRFIAAVQSSLSQRLFSIYLSQPWAFHLTRNSAELNRNISDVQSFCSTLSNLLNLLADLLVMAGVLVLLVVIEPIGAVVVGGLLVVFAWLFDRLTGAKSRSLGASRWHHSKMSTKFMLQGLGAAKDVKIYGCERDFINQYSVHKKRVATATAHHAFFAHMPRLWYELLAVVSLCALTCVLIVQNSDPRALVPTLGLFATAAFRLLPSANRLSHAVQSLRFMASPVENFRKELALDRGLPDAEPAEPMEFRQSIVIDDVTYHYPGAATPALDRISLRVDHGRAVGIIGTSGAGKSTLVDVILGLLQPQSGTIRIDGVDIQGDLRAWQRCVGYVSQSIYLCDDTIRRNVAFGVPDKRIDDVAVARAIRAAQLDTFVAGLPNGLETVVGERGVRLSGGQRQRIGIARALYRDPDVLVLDEATSALDDATERSVMEAVDALQGVKTIIIVAHRITTVERCDTVYRLEQGRIAQAGSFADVVGR